MRQSNNRPLRPRPKLRPNPRRLPGPNSPTPLHQIPPIHTTKLKKQPRLRLPLPSEPMLALQPLNQSLERDAERKIAGVDADVEGVGSYPDRDGFVPDLFVC